MSSALSLAGYKLTFDDEFNAFSWAGTGGTWQTNFYFGGRSLPSNGELEFYSDASVGVNPFAIQNGALDITASPSTNVAASGGLPYTSGLITTQTSFSQTYGYFEMRAQLPSGQGMWPAFWLLPADKSWPPELDPLEAFGAPNANGEGGATQFHLGTISSNGAQNFGTWIDTGVNLTQGYHKFGLLWDPQHLTYFFDGQQVAQTATPSDMNKPMYMLANLAVGGNWVGAPAGETAQLKIDYIRAYSSDPNAVAVVPQTISAPDGAADLLANAATPSTAPSPTATTTSTIHLHVAEDAYKGDAQFTVVFDGKQIGGVYTATASHSSGQWQDIAISGDMGVNGPGQVQINFVNDVYGGWSGADRNLYVQSIDVNGHTFLGTAAADSATNGVTVTDSAAMFVAGAVTFNTSGAAPTPTPTPLSAPAAAPNAVAAPTSTIHLHVAEDAYDGDAQFTVVIDGKQIGGVYSATTSHSSGSWQDIAVSGDMGVDGPSQVQINFVNDVYGGWSGADRNLYVQSIDVNGHSFLGTAAADTATNGVKAADSAAMYVNGTVTFNTSGSAPIVAVAPVIATPDAQATPDEARTYVAPDATGIAQGTSAADHLFATGDHQTLIGNGGDDIFDIGVHTDAKIVVGISGITTVGTWASNYTLADGVNDLWLNGTYAHNATGNGLGNWIHASDGNDTINGGAGNDVIVAGSGSYKLTGGDGKDLFAFTSPVSQNSHVTDFTVGQDMIDLRPLMKAINYAGSDPIADQTLRMVASGIDSASITLDQHDGQGPHTIVTLDHVLPTSLKAGADWVFH
jgi:beta-glucanase (GH16 family)